MTSMSPHVSLRGSLLTILLGIVLALGTVTHGEEPPSKETEQQDAGNESSAEPQPASYEEQVVVVGRATEIDTASVDLDLLDTGRAPNLGAALESVVGVTGVRRSGNSFEPVVHGLGWERVQTQVNGMPLYGACPARMDPPVSVVTSSSVESLSVVKGLASVALGPAGTGGRIDVSTDYDRGREAGRANAPWVRLNHSGASNGIKGGAGIKGGTAKIDYSAGIEIFDQGDYDSADGTTVPANQEESGGFFSFGHRVTSAERWSVSALVN